MSSSFHQAQLPPAEIVEDHHDFHHDRSPQSQVDVEQDFDSNGFNFQDSDFQSLEHEDFEIENFDFQNLGTGSSHVSCKTFILSRIVLDTVAPQDVSTNDADNSTSHVQIPGTVSESIELPHASTVNATRVTQG